MAPLLILLLATLLLGLLPVGAGAQRDLVVDCERVAAPPTLDGDLGEWHGTLWIPFGPQAGVTAWQRTWLRAEVTEPAGTGGTDADLSGRLGLRWDDDFLYLAVDVTDNVHDTDSPRADAWYQRDGVALFVDVPRDGDGPGWISGDHALHFTADEDPPPHGRWWRRGTPQGHLESAAPTGVSYRARLTEAGYAIEARVPLPLLGAFVPGFVPPIEDREVGFLVLVSDPDGGERAFGGQLMFAGQGDDDAGWAALRFVDEGQARLPRVEPAPAWEGFRTRLQADLERVRPLFLDEGATAGDDSLQAALGDDYFADYLQHRPSRLATKALWMACTLWGNAGALERLGAGLARIGDDEDVWEEVIPGLRQAALRQDRFHDMIDWLEEAAGRVRPLKSRSALLFTLAEYWVGTDRVDRARPALQDIVRWRASPWHARRAWDLLRQIEQRPAGPLPDVRG